MGEKANAIFTIMIPAGILLLLTAADFLNPDRTFSETENRLLARQPEFSQEELWSGAYTADMEAYLTDQFVGRDKWIAVKTMTDIALQRRELNGVYLGRDGYLIEQHLPEEYPAELIERRLALLEKLVERWDARVMLVPTADNVLTDRLPAYAPHFDQRAFLDRVEETVGTEHYVDVYTALQAHEEEELYYRTDHHWTSLGAFYGYQAWAEATGKEPCPYRVEAMETVSENFQGTLQSRINLEWRRDSIRYFPETEELPVSVTYDTQTAADSLYAPAYLATKNQYGFFLDDNHALVEIEVQNGKEDVLFVIKDSYANCLIPLLTPHYGRICVLDLRYYNGRLTELLEKYGEQDMDVLVLYNCVHFLEDFVYTE